MEKLPEIKNSKIVGKNLNVFIGDEKYTITGTKEELEGPKTAIKQYIEKPTKAKYNALIKLLTPKTTAKVEAKEQEITKTKAAIKTEKKVVKATPKLKKEKISKAKTSLVEDLKKAVGSGELTEKDKAAMRKLLADAKDVATPEVKEAPVNRRYGGEYR